MEKLDTETPKTLALVALAAISLMLFQDAYEMRQAMKQNEGTYQYFLAKKSGGKPLYNYIAQDSLSLFPMADGRAIVCGIVPARHDRETPTSRE